MLSLALKVRRVGGDNTCGEGECRQAIEDQLVALGLQERVIINDFSKDIHAIFSSLWEGMPNVLVESAVIGLLVIVSNILAFKSFDRSSALYVEPESIESLLQAFQVFL